MAPHKKSNNSLRIIGGAYRSRRLTFPDIAGLRPTGDRIRETLFNWLGAHVAGAHCLDLFAGSGALGFEALSRGAGTVCFVDQSQAVCQAIQDNGAKLNGAELSADNYSVICTPAKQALLSSQVLTEQSPFHITFVDPPFADNNLTETCSTLEDSGLLADDAFIYLEQPADSEPVPLPENWHLYRDKSSGNVRYQLYQRD